MLTSLTRVQPVRVQPPQGPWLDQFCPLSEIPHPFVEVKMAMFNIHRALGCGDLVAFHMYLMQGADNLHIYAAVPRSAQVCSFKGCEHLEGQIGVSRRSQG